MNRIRRLFPMYLLFVGVAVYFFHCYYEDSALKLVVFQCTGLASFRDVDFEWYIPALILLYAAFPMFYEGVKWLYGRSKWVVPLLILTIVMAVPLISKVLFPLFAYRLPIIILGILTFLAFRNKDEKYLVSVFVICALFTIVTKLGENLSLSLLVPLVLWGIGQIDVKLPFDKFFSFIGEHSLEIYLAQSLALNQYYLYSNEPFIQKCLIAFGIMVVASFVLCYFQKGFYAIASKNV